MTGRRLALAAGSVALGLSLLSILAPGLVPLSLGQVVVSLVGVLAFVQGLRVLRRRGVGLDEAETRDAELPVATPAPGDDFNTVLDEFLGGQLFYERTRIQDGLHAAAVAVLTQYGGYSEAEATEAIATGAWTDDPYAASFLGGESVPAPSRRARLWDLAQGGTGFERQDVRHTVDAIADVAGVLPPVDEQTATDARQRETAERPPDRPSSSSTTHSVDGTAPTTHSVDSTAVTIGHEPDATGHWRGVSAVALLGIGVGVLVKQPAVLLAAVVGIGFAAYAHSSTPTPGSVSLGRRISTTQADPGDEVEVSVTVRNDSDRFLPDIRLVDGVPDALSVADGSPRLGTALRPGESATITYSLTARRGVHSFGPTLLLTRDLTTALEQEQYGHVETTLTCVPPLRPLASPVPLREQATRYVGQVETPNGGTGLEFHATREYRQGDPMSRIDWNRRARTGQLTTVEFREERAATVVIVIDARAAAYVSPEPHATHAVEWCVDTAGRAFTTLSASGNRVGITALSSEPCWLAPGSGKDHRTAAQKLLATHPALAPDPDDGSTTTARFQKRFRERLSAGTQILFLTPLCDEFSSHFARRLDEYGHPVTVISPDPTADRTAGQRLSRVARSLRVSTLRSQNIPVVDCQWDEQVDTALARHGRRRQ